MFGLCRRESSAPLGISAFGCFSTQCYRAHDDVQQLQTDTSVWCSCLQICLWLPAKQSLGFRDLWCSVLRRFSATYHHIIRADLRDGIDCCTVSHIYTHENTGGCVSGCVVVVFFPPDTALTVCTVSELHDLLSTPGYMHPSDCLSGFYSPFPLIREKAKNKLVKIKVLRNIN